MCAESVTSCPALAATGILGPMDGIAIGPDGGERVGRAPRDHRILAELDQFEVVELCFSPDFEGVPPRAHRLRRLVLRPGRRGRVLVGDSTFRAPRGSFVAAPPGTRHGFRNAGDGDLRMLNIHAPYAGFAQRLRGG